MGTTDAPAPLVHETLSPKVLVKDLGRGHRPAGVQLDESSSDLIGAPAGPVSPELEGSLEHLGVRGVRTRVRSVGAVGEAVRPFSLVSVEPLVAGLTADAVTPTELGVREETALGLQHKSFTLVHGIGLQPWHRRPLVEAPRYGRDCHPSGVREVLPINGGCTGTASQQAVAADALQQVGILKSQRIRATRHNRLAGGVRVFLGILFLMTGAMKLVVPMLAEAWAGQLAAASVPLEELNRLAVPFVELGVGVALLLGYFARIAALVVLGIMVVATYVHVVVADPSLFPLQPSEPVIPAVVMVLAAYLLLRGAGAGSLDLKASRKGRKDV
jgi:putative oxidoreductase